MLDEHLGYVADRTRLEQFRAAIAAVVRSGDEVVDLRGRAVGRNSVAYCAAWSDAHTAQYGRHKHCSAWR